MDNNLAHTAFDEKSLGFCFITIILNAGPQMSGSVAAVTSVLTSLAAVSTVTYNILRAYIDFKNKQKEK